MTGATVVIIALVAVGVGIGALLLYGTSGRSNSWPALGTNLDQRGFGMVWWKRTWLGQRASPSVPEVDEALGPHYDILTVDQELDRAYHPHHADHQRPPARSWMDEPGAMERDGLVDADEPAEERTDRGSR